MPNHLANIALPLYLLLETAALSIQRWLSRVDEDAFDLIPSLES
jgi:hypothetical protein